MKRFDLDTWNEQQKVVTANGLAVRIVATDRRDDISGECIVALVDLGETEAPYTYRPDGTSDSCDKDFWLYLATENFTRWINVIQNEDGSFSCTELFDNEDEAHAQEKELSRNGIRVCTNRFDFEI